MVKTLLKSVRQYKRASIETPVFVAMEVVLECTIPLIMSKLIDDADLKVRRASSGPCDHVPVFWSPLRKIRGNSRMRTCKEPPERSLF